MINLVALTAATFAVLTAYRLYRPSDSSAEELPPQNPEDWQR